MSLSVWFLALTLGVQYMIVFLYFISGGFETRKEFICWSIPFYWVYYVLELCVEAWENLL